MRARQWMGLAAGERNRQTTKSDIVEMNLHVPLEEVKGTTLPQPFARAVVRLVRDERISRERALELLQGTFANGDLPRPFTSPTVSSATDRR